MLSVYETAMKTILEGIAVVLNVVDCLRYAIFDRKGEQLFMIGVKSRQKYAYMYSVQIVVDLGHSSV